MATLVRYEQHVTAQLQQGADEQNQVPPVDGEEIQEHEELALDQNLADRRLHKRIHADAAAAGRSRTCCAMSAANVSSSLSARRRNSVPGAPIDRSARPAARRTLQAESRRRAASTVAAFQCCIRPSPWAAAALTLESSSSSSSISRSAPAASPTAPNSLAAAIRTPSSSLRDKRSAAGPKLGSASDSATRRPASAARPVWLSRKVASGPATTPPMRRSAFCTAKRAWVAGSANSFNMAEITVTDG